jgi:hypothetical protein
MKAINPHNEVKGSNPSLGPHYSVSEYYETYESKNSHHERGFENTSN